MIRSRVYKYLIAQARPHRCIINTFTKHNIEITELTELQAIFLSYLLGSKPLSLSLVQGQRVQSRKFERKISLEILSAQVLEQPTFFILLLLYVTVSFNSYRRPKSKPQQVIILMITNFKGHRKEIPRIILNLYLRSFANRANIFNNPSQTAESLQTNYFFNIS